MCLVQTILCASDKLIKNFVWKICTLRTNRPSEIDYRGHKVVAANSYYLPEQHGFRADRDTAGHELPYNLRRTTRSVVCPKARETVSSTHKQ